MREVHFAMTVTLYNHWVQQMLEDKESEISQLSQQYVSLDNKFQKLQKANATLSSEYSSSYFLRIHYRHSKLTLLLTLGIRFEEQLKAERAKVNELEKRLLVAERHTKQIKEKLASMEEQVFEPCIYLCTVCSLFCVCVL